MSSCQPVCTEAHNLLAAELDYSGLGPTGMLREGQLESQMSKDNDIDVLQTYLESQMSKDNDKVSMHRTPGH